MPPPEAPLARYTVLDFTIARAGPTAVRLLADWGANVIRIEAPAARQRARDDRPPPRPRRAEPASQQAQPVHRPEVAARPRGARSPGARSDVVVENFRADVKERLGLDYERLRAINPRVVLASISGFGQDGPYGDRPGVDQIVQGLSGLMSITGEPGRGPMRVGIAISDTTAGMFLGQGILLALLHRERTGDGQWVHTSLLEAMLNKLDFQGARYTMSGEVPGQAGQLPPDAGADGHVPRERRLGQPRGQHAEDVGRAVRGARRASPRPAPRLRQCRAAQSQPPCAQRRAQRCHAALHAAELVERLNPVGVPCGPIYDIGEAFEDPQVQHLRMTRAAAHRPRPREPGALADQPVGLPAPRELPPRRARPRPTQRRGAARVRLRRRADRDVGEHRSHCMTARGALDTDKILAEVDSGIGWLRSTIRSAATRCRSKCGRASAMRSTLSKPTKRARGRDERRGRQRVRRRRRHLRVRPAPRERRAKAALRRDFRARPLLAFALDKPFIAMIQGFCIGGGLAIALNADVRFAAGFALRHSGRKTRARLRIPRNGGVRAAGRPVVGPRHPVQRAFPKPTKRCASAWSTSSCAADDARGARACLCRDDCRQRAADDPRLQSGDQRVRALFAPRRCRRGHRWSTAASTATTTAKAARPSWKSGHRASPDADCTDIAAT